MQANISSFRRQLTLCGGNTKTLSLEELKALPRTDKITQVGCESRSNGKPLPTSLFGGVLLRNLLPKSARISRGITFHAMDGEKVTLSNYSDYDNILISYEENGAPLTHTRGFPLRIIIPGRRVIKWVKRIEIL